MLMLSLCALNQVRCDKAHMGIKKNRIVLKKNNCVVVFQTEESISTSTESEH